MQQRVEPAARRPAERVTVCRVPGLADFGQAQAVRVDRDLFVSGQLGLDVHGHLVGLDDCHAQAVQCFHNIQAILEASGAQLADVVKVICYLTDRNDMDGYAKARRQFLEHLPATTTVVVKELLLPGALLEVDVVAVLPDAPSSASAAKEQSSMSPSLGDLVSQAVAAGPPLFFPQPEMPIHYNFDQGNPATETFPLAELASIEARIRADVGGPALDYFDADTGYEELVYGWRGLRAVLADRFAARDDAALGPMNLILTSGSVHGIALVAKAFLDPGDVVLVEAATFPYAVNFFAAAGAEIVTVPVDSDGMRVDILDAEIRRLKGEGRQPKLVYTIPTFQLPTGSCMSLARRRELVELAQRERVMVHEDNVYAELRYEGEPLPTLFSLDDQGLVLQSDSFSKTVAPALRLGWVMGTEEAIGALAAVRQDLGVNQFTARVMAEYTASGLLDDHIEDVQRIYKEKRDVAVAALREHCGEWVDFEVPAGSFFLWLRISDRIDWDKAAELVAAEGVFCRPGERFAGETNGARYLRMAFSNVTTDVIADGVAALGRALKASVRS